MTSKFLERLSSVMELIMWAVLIVCVVSVCAGAYVLALVIFLAAAGFFSAAVAIETLRIIVYENRANPKLISKWQKLHY